MSRWEKARRFWRRFQKAQSGTTAIIFGVIFIPVLALSGGVVDFGRAVKTKAQLANTLDAAVLAGLKDYSLDDTVDYKAVITHFIEENLTKEDKIFHGQELNISVSDMKENGEVTATVATDVNTYFLSLVGFNSFNVAVSSTAVSGGRNLEIVLVLDNTGSMGDPATGGGTKIEALRSSAKDLVNILLPDATSDRVKIALVPFAEYVNIGIDMRGEDGLDIPADYSMGGTDYKWVGCMGSRKHPHNVKDNGYGNKVPGIMMFDDPVVDYDDDSTPYESWRCPAASVIDLTDDKSTIISGIDDMVDEGWTYIPGGLSWGWRVLSETAPFATGVPYSDQDTTKVIVLMTDGENTRAPLKWTNDATSNNVAEVWGHSKHVSDGAAADADGYTTELCNAIKAKNIVVFTIAFEVPDGSPVETLMKNCAGNGGQFFDADSSEQLENAFHQIGLSLLNLRLSQ